MRTAKRRLEGLDFSGEKCHVALVDHGAQEHDELLVLKRRDPKANAEDNNLNKQKEDNMSLEANKQTEEVLKAKLAQEAKMVELEKAAEDQKAVMVELEKAKADQDALIVELEKAKADQAVQLEEVEKARVEKVREEMVVKAKDLKADDADKFGDILVKCKVALDEDQYLELVKQLEKLQNITKSGDLIKNLGEGSTSVDVEKKFFEKRDKFIEKGLTGYEASTKARLEIAAESK